MITKHFFKTLLLFTVMIGLGLLFVFIVSYFDSEADPNLLNTAKIAK
ncbi:MAG: hypothetical protein WCO07_03385 [bacterium]